MAHFTKNYHQKPYDAISPTQPALSQAGRTVMITGASGGIGLATAHAFAAASAARVIVTARREDALKDAKKEIEAKYSSTEVQVEVCDVGDLESIKKLWAKLAQQSVEVDVLVLNAVRFGTPESLISEDATQVLSDIYQTNLIGGHLMSQKFLTQGKKTGKVLLNTSTAAIHMNPLTFQTLAYATTKNAFTHLVQVMAYEVPVEHCQIISYHPGAVLTPGARSAGFKEDTIPWDQVDLPGHFAVWAATKDAAFLHGRFTWAAWPIDELKEMKDRIQSDPGFLRVGLQGPDSLNAATFWDQVKEIAQRAGN